MFATDPKKMKMMLSQQTWEKRCFNPAGNMLSVTCLCSQESWRLSSHGVFLPSPLCGNLPVPSLMESLCSRKPRASPTGRGRPCSNAGRGHQLISTPVTVPGDGCLAWLLAQHRRAGVASRCSPVAGYLLVAGARLVPVQIPPSSAGAVRAGSRFPCKGLQHSTGAMMWSQVGQEQWAELGWQSCCPAPEKRCQHLCSVHCSSKSQQQ